MAATNSSNSRPKASSAMAIAGDAATTSGPVSLIFAGVRVRIGVVASFRALARDEKKPTAESVSAPSEPPIDPYSVAASFRALTRDAKKPPAESVSAPSKPPIDPYSVAASFRALARDEKKPSAESVSTPSKPPIDPYSVFSHQPD